MKQYDPNVFRDRLLLTIGENGISMADISRAIGTNYSTVAHWLYQGNSPSSWNLMLLAEYLNVSPRWLIGMEET